MEVTALIVSIIAILISGWTAFRNWNKDRRELKHTVKTRISLLISNYINLQSNFENLLDNLESIDVSIPELVKERESAIESLKPSLETLNSMIDDATQLLKDMGNAGKVADDLYELEISVPKFQSSYNSMHEKYQQIVKNIKKIPDKLI
jgi:chromosome segregation ATPase